MLGAWRCSELSSSAARAPSRTTLFVLSDALVVRCAWRAHRCRYGRGLLVSCFRAWLSEPGPLLVPLGFRSPRSSGRFLLFLRGPSRGPRK
jgi:hypothetical protein